jgi:hypothetical protein
MSHQRAQCTERRTLGSAGGCAEKAQTGPRRAAHPTGDASDPWGIAVALMDTTPAGSYLVISHATTDNLADDDRAGIQAGCSRCIRRRHRTSSSPPRKTDFYGRMKMTRSGETPGRHG